MDLIRAMYKRASQLESQSEEIDGELGRLRKAIGDLTGGRQNSQRQKAHPWTPERRKKFQATMAAKRKNGGNSRNGKRIISAAARAKMSRAAKARWAESKGRK